VNTLPCTEWTRCIAVFSALQWECVPLRHYISNAPQSTCTCSSVPTVAILFGNNLIIYSNQHASEKNDLRTSTRKREVSRCGSPMYAPGHVGGAREGKARGRPRQIRGRPVLETQRRCRGRNNEPEAFQRFAGGQGNMREKGARGDASLLPCTNRNPYIHFGLLVSRRKYCGS
jgi:hypothetical protein